LHYVILGNHDNHANFAKATKPRKAKMLFDVPFERDKNFVSRTDIERRDIMNTITQTFITHGRIALAGIGGVG
jgi:hypothetical protein